MKLVFIWIVLIFAFLLGVSFDRSLCIKAIKFYRNEANKYFGFFYILEQWLSNKHSSLEVYAYLEQRGYHEVAIYGMGVLGNLLCSELQNVQNINVKYAIDRCAKEMFFDIPVIEPDEEYPDVDVIVVTAIAEYEKIKERIQQKTELEVISLEEIVYGAAEI